MLLLAVLSAALAFVSALPVTGPGAVLVADAALRGERLRGALIGLGAAIPELGWATLAWLGAGSAVDGNPALRAGAHAAGGVALVVVAVLVWRGGSRAPLPPGRSHHRALLLGMATTAANPTMLLTWGGVSAALIAGGYGSPGHRDAMVFGSSVGFGSAASGVALVLLFERVRGRLGEAAPRWFSRGAAILLAALGLAALARASLR